MPGRYFSRKAGGKFPRLTEAERDTELQLYLGEYRAGIEAGDAIPDQFVIFNVTAGRYQFYDFDDATWRDHTGAQPDADT